MPYTGRLEVTPLLDIVQIIAYSQQSGLLSVKGSDTKGLLIFQAGNIICAYSPSALPLLVKAAKEQNPDNRLSFRRIQVLAALRELVDISEGDYRFVKKAEPITELEGLDMKLFYASGPLDTGDLLLVLQKAMDEPENIRVNPRLSRAIERGHRRSCASSLRADRHPSHPRVCRHHGRRLFD